MAQKQKDTIMVKMSSGWLFRNEYPEMWERLNKNALFREKSESDFFETTVAVITKEDFNNLKESVPEIREHLGKQKNNPLYDQKATNLNVKPLNKNNVVKEENDIVVFTETSVEGRTQTHYTAKEQTNELSCFIPCVIDNHRLYVNERNAGKVIGSGGWKASELHKHLGIKEVVSCDINEFLDPRNERASIEKAISGLGDDYNVPHFNNLGYVADYSAPAGGKTLMSSSVMLSKLGGKITPEETIDDKVRHELRKIREDGGLKVLDNMNKENITPKRNVM